MIEVQKLPEELEVSSIQCCIGLLEQADAQQTLVKDLWALRLQKLRTRISHESDAETDPRSSQVFSSQTESETLTGSQSQSSRRSRRKDAGPREETPNLSEILNLCYIGMLLLRIPVTVADVHKWTKEGELLYYRASRELPLGMRARLPGPYQELLEPQDLLQPQLIHQSIVEILTMLRMEFGMATPPINTPLILYKWIQDLALPLEVFVASQRLARILNIDGTFCAGGSNIVLRYPEVRLMALVVIATKLLLPFDEIERHPQSITELSGLSMNWDEWVEAHKNADKKIVDQSQLNFEKAFNFTESNCTEAADETLDAYLDWYSDNIATEEVRERGQAGRDANFRRALFRMFPVHSGQSAGTPQPSDVAKNGLESKIRHVQSTLRPRRVEKTQTTKDAPRSGCFYRRFRSVEDLSGPMKIFFEKAAMLAGLPLDGMVQAVFLTERRVQNHEEALRKTTKARPTP